MTAVKDGFAVGSDLTERMAIALCEATNDEPHIQAIYSDEGPNESEIERDIPQNEVSAVTGYWTVLQTFDDDPMSGDTQNIIRTGSGLLFMIGRESRSVVDALYHVLRSAGYTTGCTDSNGVEAVGKPVGAPFAIGRTMTAWTFDPGGGTQLSTRSYGDYQAIAQFIDFKVQVFDI